MEIYALDATVIRMFAGLYEGNIIDYFTEEAVGLGMMEDGKPIGLLLGKVAGEDISFDWIYISAEYCGKGYGQKLFQKFYESVVKVPNINRIVATCVESRRMEGFLLACGFNISNIYEFKEYETTFDELIPLPRGKKYNIKKLKEATPGTLRNFNHFLFQNASISCGAELPIQPEEYQDCSMIVESGEQIVVAILMKESADGLTIPFVYAAKGYEVAMVYAVAEVAEEVKRNYPTDQKIIFGLLNEESLSLARKLFPQSKEEIIYHGYLPCRRD